MYGQTRILFAMGRDGMLPHLFARVSPRTQTPVNNTIIVAIVVAILAAILPLDYLTDVVSIGTLTAFIVVSLGVIILRYREPDLPRFGQRLVDAGQHRGDLLADRMPG
jgi:amino acid transporter